MLARLSPLHFGCCHEPVYSSSYVGATACPLIPSNDRNALNGKKRRLKNPERADPGGARRQRAWRHLGSTDCRLGCQPDKHDTDDSPIVPRPASLMAGVDAPAAF